MSLPESNQAPYYWIGAAVILLAAGLYLGSGDNLPFLIAGVGGGAAALARGLWLFRTPSSSANRSGNEVDEFMNQTCELNVRPDAVPNPIPRPRQD